MGCNVRGDNGMCKPHYKQICHDHLQFTQWPMIHICMTWPRGTQCEPPHPDCVANDTCVFFVCIRCGVCVCAPILNPFLFDSSPARPYQLGQPDDYHVTLSPSYDNRKRAIHIYCRMKANIFMEYIFLLSVPQGTRVTVANANNFSCNTQK